MDYLFCVDGLKALAKITQQDQNFPLVHFFDFYFVSEGVFAQLQHDVGFFL